MSDSEDKGFKVTDRRIDHEDGDETAQEPQAAADAEEPEEAPPGEPEATDDADPAAAADDDEGPPPVPMTFSTLLMSLGTSALAALGDVPELAGAGAGKNLPMARQTIDILGILEEKTKGNLTDEEAKLLGNLLYDLRIRYVQAESSAG